ncbi:MAG: hypothetical protein ACLVB5_00725 [Christensenellales bacterium]
MLTVTNSAQLSAARIHPITNERVFPPRHIESACGIDRRGETPSHRHDSDYRAFDTLGESHGAFTAAMVVLVPAPLDPASEKYSQLCAAR